jgi:hypothetical protein
VEWSASLEPLEAEECPEVVMGQTISQVMAKEVQKVALPTLENLVKAQLVEEAP